MSKKITYKVIQDYVRENFGYTIKTCAIARVKRLLGIKVRTVWNTGMSKHPVIPTQRDIDAVKAAYYFYGIML